MKTTREYCFVAGCLLKAKRSTVRNYLVLRCRPNFDTPSVLFPNSWTSLRRVYDFKPVFLKEKSLISKANTESEQEFSMSCVESKELGTKTQQTPDYPLPFVQPSCFCS